MQQIRAMLLILVAVLTTPPSSARGGFVSGSIDVTGGVLALGDGLSPPVLKDTRIHQDYSGDYSVSGSATTMGNGWSAHTGVATFTADASLSAVGGNLKASASATGGGGWDYSPKGIASANITWSDSVLLVYHAGAGDGLVVDHPTSLNFTFVLTGSLATSKGNNYYSNWSYFAESGASIGIGFLNGTSWQTIFGDSIGSNAAVSWARADKLITYDKTVVGSVTLDALNRGTYSYTLSAWAYSADGFGTADFGHTLRLQSITFADGTTPESHGWELQFASGIASPNVARVSAAPEPSTFVISSIFFSAIGSVWSYKRRNSDDKGGGRRF